MGAGTDVEEGLGVDDDGGLGILRTGQRKTIVDTHSHPVQRDASLEGGRDGGAFVPVVVGASSSFPQPQPLMPKLEVGKKSQHHTPPAQGTASPSQRPFRLRAWSGGEEEGRKRAAEGSPKARSQSQ